MNSSTYSKLIFCKKCHNLLYLQILDNTMRYLCHTCNSEYPYNDEDTLVYEETKEEKINTFTPMFMNITEDPLNPRTKVKCPKCSHNVSVNIRLPDSMRLLRVCEKCKESIPI
jgi:DNA-directed RNA polymerase subunit M/transcription elongation factor TFIIS